MAHERLRPSYFFDQEKIDQLKQIAPECFEDGKINFESLRQNLGDWAQNEDDPELEHFGLFWPGKRDARKAAALPPEGTLEPVWGEGLKADGTPDTDGVNDSKNIFIEGENLEVLKILQKSYAGKIKMIYIDPPYNTGNDFVYDDDFTEPLQEYLRRTGQVDEEGKPMTTNKRSDGRFHSKWLSMMYPRLRLARNLLREDGVIFVSIDDNEVHNLRALMNEIFGEENFIANIIWEKRFTRSNNAKLFASLTEHIILFRKSDALETIKEPRNEKSDSIYSNPDNDPRGVWTSVSYVNPATREQRPNLAYDIVNPLTKQIVRHPTNAWKYEFATYQQHVNDNKLYWGQQGGNTYPRLKKFLTEMEGGMVPANLWSHKETGTTDQGSKILEELLKCKAFDFPKPPSLIKRMLKLATSKEDIILDFFGGSGTTAHAVYELNKEDGGSRKFICIQIPEPTGENSDAFNAGYKTISAITKERIRRIGKKLRDENKDNLDFGFKTFKLGRSNFNQWTSYSGVSIQQLQIELEQVNLSPLRNTYSKEGLITEVMLLEGYTLCSIAREVGSIKSNSVKKIENQFCDHTLLICLDEKVSGQTVENLQVTDDDVFICLDSAVDLENKLRLSDKGLIKTI